MELSRRIAILTRLYNAGLISKDIIEKERTQYRDGLLAYVLKKKREHDELVARYECSHTESDYIEDLIAEGESYYSREELEAIVKSIKKS